MQELFSIVLESLPLAQAEDFSGEGIAALVVGLLFYGLLFSIPVIGIISGFVIESKHFESIERREQEFADILVTDLKTPPPGQVWQQPCLVSGSAVIATDYFKTLAAGFRKFFGGEFHGLKKMQDRARREAILRMLAEARSQGAGLVCNVRIDTATIGGKSRKKIAGVEILATGTALVAGEGTVAPTNAPPLPQA